MSSIWKYKNLRKHIINWPLYFKRKYVKSDQPAVYKTKGNKLDIEVPNRFFHVFQEIFMEDFYGINTMLERIPAKPVVIDIGANVGYFSFLLAAKRKDAMIYAFEPMQQNTTVFERNITLNAGLKRHVQLQQKAVTGKPVPAITLYFDNHDHNTVIASVFNDFDTHNQETVSIPAISLQEILAQNNLQQVDLLKMDCEGSEYPILYDSPETIWPVIKALAIEVHEMDNNRRNGAYLSNFLEQKGYTIDKRLDPNGCYYFFAHR
jgi:FkbM family methyltransferase